MRRPKVKPGTVQMMRMVRMITYVRMAILKSIEDERRMSTADFVAEHQRFNTRLYNKFPYIGIHNRYISTVAGKLAQDIVYYVKHGTTPGGP